jgi:hypothetical protein
MKFAIFYQIVLFLILTLITQIGGLVFIVSLIICKKIKRKFFWEMAVIFTVLYCFSTFYVVPPIASVFGRERVITNKNLKPANYWTIILNRNYVKPEVNNLLSNTSDEIMDLSPNIRIHYLDANFPFIDGFPLLPHLSHNDGKKLDLSFIYQDAKGNQTNLLKSRSGYGVFEGPNENEENFNLQCKNKGFYQYDFAKFFTFGTIHKDLQLSEKHTSKLITLLLENNFLEKIFIEPHLSRRMRLTDQRIRFQGCHSVRHDDHIHFQIK